MPDANGNLLGIEDFVEHRVVRLISYLDENLVLACNLDGARVHNLANDASGLATEWTILTRGDGTFELAVSAYPDSGGWLCWQSYENDDEPLWLQFRQMLGTGSDTTFCVDMLDGGCWFALNNADRSRVADVKESVTTEGNPVIPYPWNGGDNQRWRAQIV